MKLYEISNKYIEFMELIETGELEEEAIKDTLESIEDEFKEKADNIACMIKNTNAEIEAINAEIRNLRKRNARKMNQVKNLTDYLKNQMIMMDKQQIETTRNKICIRKNPQTIEIEDGFIEWAEKNADHLLKYQTPIPNKKEIKEELKKGEEIPHVIISQKEGMLIK